MNYAKIFVSIHAKHAPIKNHNVFHAFKIINLLGIIVFINNFYVQKIVKYAHKVLL